MRPLLVGEDNPYGSDPRYALYPEPQHSAGGRLCRLIMGLTVKQYIGSFDRANLCSRKWSIREARLTAQGLLGDPASRTAIVLLGAKVCSAFGFKFDPYLVGASGVGYPLVILPHPSGRNLIWNQRGSYDRARAALREAGVLTNVTDEDPELVDPTCRNCGKPVSGPKRSPSAISALDGPCSDCGPER